MEAVLNSCWLLSSDSESEPDDADDAERVGDDVSDLFVVFLAILSSALASSLMLVYCKVSGGQNTER